MAHNCTEVGLVNDDFIDQWRSNVASSLDPATSPVDSVLELSPRLEVTRKRKRSAMSTNDDETQGNFELTPRPAKRASEVLDHLSQCSSRSSKRARSVAASRSSSPIKQMAILHSLSSPTTYDNFEKESVKAMDTSMQTLVKEMRRCSGGQRIVPRALSDSLRARNDEEPIWNGQDVWRDTDDQDLDQVPILPQIEMLVQESNRCKERIESEAGWGTHVHGPLLILATWLSRHRNRVGSVNLTHARLLPRLHPQQTVSGKMVDFGIFLQKSESLELSWTNIAPEDGGAMYWNHTSAFPVLRTPLAVAVEAKRQGEGGIKSMLQISVWSRAHLQRLVELGQRPMSKVTICLPLLVVQGEAWSFHVARGEIRDGHLIKTVIHSDISLGDTSTFYSCFKVLAAVMAIVEWCEVTYRPWFEAWVAGPHDTNVSDSSTLPKSAQPRPASSHQ